MPRQIFRFRDMNDYSQDIFFTKCFVDSSTGFVVSGFLMGLLINQCQMFLEGKYKITKRNQNNRIITKLKIALSTLFPGGLFCALLFIPTGSFAGLKFAL